MPKIILQKSSTSEDWENIKKIRKAIFQYELKISEDNIFDSDDRKLDQFLIRFDDGLLIGALRMRHNDVESMIERMCILNEHRKQGYGKQVLEQVKQYCRSKNQKKILLDSIYDVRNFYKKCGFEETGPIHKRVGLRHIMMYFVL